MKYYYSLTYTWNWLTDYLNINISEKHLTSGLVNQTEILIKQKLHVIFSNQLSWPILLCESDSFFHHLQICSETKRKRRKEKRAQEKQRKAWPREPVVFNSHLDNHFTVLPGTHSQKLLF